MRPEGQKKVAAHYGALCGLRSGADSDSDDSTISKPSLKQGPATPPMPRADKSILRPRPESLTLPFENRERESHLVSEEEFDRIIKQEELNNPLPRLPTSVDRGAAIAGRRRSISTARNARMSAISQRLRPMSADSSRMVPNTAGQREQSTEPFPALPRDPTLTALPRVPTRNDMMVYPVEADTPTGRRLPAYTNLSRTPSTINYNRVSRVENEALAHQTQAQKKGHKRHFSAADMVDSMKKRIKRQNPHDAEYEQARAAISLSSPPAGSPMVLTNSEHEPQPNSHSNDDNNPRSSGPSMESSRSQTNKAPESLKKSLLKRTWSKTKHAAKLSISSPGSKLKISDPLATPSSTTPLAHQGRDTPTPVPSTLTTGTTDTTGYYASPEPSPQLSQRPSTPTPSNGSSGGLGPLQQSSYEYISGPAPRRGLLTKLGAPPSRNELNTMVARQQNRIVDLTLQNNVLVNQIELLRSEVQGMKVHSDGVGVNGGRDNAHDSYRSRPQSAYILPPPRSALRTEDSGRVHTGGTAQQLSEDEVQEISAGMTRRTPRQGPVQGQSPQSRSFDPNGWRRIVGVRQEREQEHNIDDHMDIETDTGRETDADMSKDDKRKTWMTCDS